MKATVIESQDGRSVILTEDGSFYTIEGSYIKGESIDYNSSSRKQVSNGKRLAVICAIAAGCLVLGLICGYFFAFS